MMVPQGFVALADALSHPVALLDGELRLCASNTAFATSFVRRDGDLTGASLETLVGEVAHVELAPHVRRALSGQRGSFARGHELFTFAPYAEGDLHGCIVTVHEGASVEIDARVLRLVDHDLRGQLLNLSLAGTLLSSGTPSEDSNADIGELVASSGRRLREITRDLLDYAFVRRGHPLRLDRQSVDLAELLRSEIAELAHGLSNHTLQLEQADAVSVALDKSRMQQLVQNLLRHAVRYGPPKGVARITLSAGPDAMVLSVVVQGSVLSAVQRAAMFLDVEDDESVDRNAGIGLYLARAIASAHGGTLEVESSEERGTVFSARLPRLAA